MICIDETIKEYGYNPDNLSAKSQKRIIAECIYCHNKRSIKKAAYRDKCKKCSDKMNVKVCNQTRPDNSGLNNHFYGKKHSDKTRELISHNVKSSLSKFRLPEGVAAYNRIISHYKNGAKAKGLVFDLSDDDLKMLFKSRCHYCNAEPNGISRHKGGNGDFVYSGIDRVDNNVGYIRENCVPCCKICNWGKRNMEYNDFLSWIKEVYNHRICNDNSKKE